MLLFALAYIGGWASEIWVRNPGSTSSSVRAGPVMDRTFTIQFLDPDVQAYAFTFG
jgi:hypothetical protein